MGGRTSLVVLAALAALLALTGGGCQPAETDQAATPEVSYPEVLPGPTGPEDRYNRQAQAPVPAGLSPKAIEFATVDRGYALFEGCVAGRPCRVALAVTLDGGSSWLARTLPFAEAAAAEMRLGRGNVLMLKLDPHGWFVSRDSGRTFQQRPPEPPPSELNLAGPQFQIGCLDTQATPCGANTRLLEIGPDGAKQALPSQPGVANFSSMALGADGRLWLVAEATDGSTSPLTRTVTAWVSTDHGKSWSSAGSTRFNPASVGSRTVVVVSPDGGDVWIVDNGFAAMRAADGRWVEATAMREIDRFSGAEAMPGGKVLIAGPAGTWAVGLQQRYRDARARGIFSLRRIDQSVVQGYVGQQSGEVWLCAWTDPTCTWTRVSVSAPQS